MCTDTDPLESTYSELGGTLAPFPAKSDLESIFQDARGGLWPNTRCSTENTRHGWLPHQPRQPNFEEFLGLNLWNLGANWQGERGISRTEPSLALPCFARRVWRVT